MAKGEQEEKSRMAKKDKQYISQKASGQDWFYHAPITKKTEKPEKVLPVSQIPGFGDLDNSQVDLHNDIHLRRKWIRETDSKYVKLAKEGGRKDLFIYREHKPSERGIVQYPRVDWFDHYVENSQNKTEDEKDLSATTYKSSFPEWYVHDDASYRQEIENPSKKKRQILAFDDMSYWKREAAEEEKRRTKSTPVKFPSLGNNKTVKTTQIVNAQNYDANTTRLPNIVSKQKQDANIGQLLSMHYHHEWLDEQAEKRQARENKKARNIGHEKQILDGDQKSSKRATKDKDSKQNEEKPLFKLTRFANVPARTDNHRT